ncbi:hypothetical protein CFC21_042025, partial [Triticum aestivum]
PAWHRRVSRAGLPWGYVSPPLPRRV